MNLFIAIPCYGGKLNNLTFNSIVNSIDWLRNQNHSIRVDTLSNESLVNRARNTFVTKFLDEKEFNGTHLLFIDADIVFTIDNLKRIIDFNKDIVTCTYPTKSLAWNKLQKKIKYSDKEQIQNLLMQYNINLYDDDNIQTFNGFARVKESATGFMLIKKEVFTTIMNKFQNLKYTPDLRSGIEGSDNAYDFFPVGCYKEKNGITRFLSEDYYFCRLAEECGFEIWTDISTPITHLGSFEYSGRYIDQLIKK